MAFNLTALISGANAVANHNVTKGSALAALITGGLYAAGAAGLVVPPLAFAVAPVAGLLLYKFLPVKAQQEVDAIAQQITDVANEVPNTYSAPTDFPNPPPTNPAPNNLNKG